jgi:hypothetical protein
MDRHIGDEAVAVSDRVPSSSLISTLNQLTVIASASPRSGTSHSHW